MQVITNIKRVEAPGYSGFGAGEIICGYYETKCGLLYGGDYMDDILSQKFGIVYFKSMSVVRQAGYWIVLEDINLEIGVGLASPDLATILINNSIYILLGILATIFILALIRGRIWLKH